MMVNIKKMREDVDRRVQILRRNPPPAPTTFEWPRPKRSPSPYTIEPKRQLDSRERQLPRGDRDDE